MVLVGVAVAVGVWVGSFGAQARASGPDTESPSEPVFLPAADTIVPTPGAAYGATVFEQRCAGCHTIGGGDREGPDLAQAALRRNPVWVQAMIAAPDSMFRTDSLAQWVLRVHDIATEDATEENPDLRAVAAFFARFAPAP